MRIHYWLFASLLFPAVFSRKAGEDKLKSWSKAFRYCLRQNKTLPPVERASKGDANWNQNNKDYLWSAEYMMHIQLIRQKSDPNRFSYLCGYHVLSEAMKDTIPHFGSCAVKRHYVTKDNYISKNKITWEKLLVAEDACKKNCHTKPQRRSDSTTYWSYETRWIFNRNDRDSIPKPQFCVAYNGKKEKYSDCKDTMQFRCIPSTEDEAHEVTTLLQASTEGTSPTTHDYNNENMDHSKEMKREKDRTLLVSLFVCVGLSFTLVIGLIVSFVCYQRKLRRKGANRENNQQPEANLGNEAEYDYITGEEVCAVSEYYKTPQDAVELAKIESDKYIEPYDSKLTASGNRTNEQASGDLIRVSTPSIKENEKYSFAHAYNKVIIRPSGEDNTYDVAIIHQKNKNVENTENVYDTCERNMEIDAGQIPAVSGKRMDNEAGPETIADNKILSDSFVDFSREKESEVPFTHNPVSVEPSGPLYHILEEKDK